MIRPWETALQFICRFYLRTWICQCYVIESEMRSALRLALCVLLNNHITSKQPLCIMKCLFYLLIKEWNISITPWVKKKRLFLKVCFPSFRLLQKTNTIKKSLRATRELWAKWQTNPDFSEYSLFFTQHPNCLKIIEFPSLSSSPNDSCHIHPKEN